MAEEKNSKDKEKDKAPKEENSPSNSLRDNSIDLISPEGCMILFIAVILDLIGLFLFVLSFFIAGIPLSWLLDIAGMVIIGGWLLVRTGRIKKRGGKNNAEIIKKITKKTGKRFGIAFLIELVPFLGDISPSWTVLVFLELRNKG